VKRILLGVGIVLVLAAVVFLSIRGGRGKKGVKVYAEAAARQDISRLVKASGEINPRLKVNLSAHVIGKIEKLYVKEGDAIAAGQPFLELEKDTFVAVRDATRAQLEIQRSRLLQAELQARDAALKLERARRLEVEKISSREQREAAELQHLSFLQAAEQAREAIAQSTADLKKANEDLSKTTIFSPLSGRVVALNAEQGEVVVSGTMNNPGSVIGTIADLSEILAEVDVDETEIVHVRVGQSVTVLVDALQDREFSGKVVEIGSSGYSRPQQPDVTFFKVKVLLDEPAETLRPGMSARAEILTATSAATIVIPIQAAVERSPLPAKAESPGSTAGDADEEIQVVFVVEQDRVQQRPVTLGITDATSAEVLSGLTDGERVVTGPYRTLKKLKDGDAVKIGKEPLAKEDTDQELADNDAEEEDD
jgi:HlyD family secretion protein